MILVNDGPSIPSGMCGIFLLEITGLIYAPYKSPEGRTGYIFRYKVKEPTMKQYNGVIITDTFYLGTGSRRLDMVLKKIGLKRTTSIYPKDCIGKEVWVCIGKEDLVNQDGEVEETYSYIFDYNLVNANKERPIYLGDPAMNNGSPSDKFYRVIRTGNAIPIAEEQMESVEEVDEISF